MSIKEANGNPHTEVAGVNETNSPHKFASLSPAPTKYPVSASSVSDSAYNSLVCSPFSPVGLVNSSKPQSTNDTVSFVGGSDPISPFLESGDHEDVFQVSLEQLDTDRTCQSTEKRTYSNFRPNVTFRPISSDQELRRNYTMRERSADIPIRGSLRSHRSISTQTKFSMSSTGVYRPNSAPLQEGIEEELEEINIERQDDANYRMHRNSTCNCMRSPMPDLIQPAFQNNHQLLGSRLSLIADQIDESINSQQTSRTRLQGRSRRFSTSSIGDLTPAGSLIDLFVSIYHAFDNTVPRRRRSENTTSSN